MTELERLHHYDAVNACETLDELANVIGSIADEDGKIQGNTRKFDARIMAHNVKSPLLINNMNLLTRSYGIRQQAIYILYYENKIKL